MKARNLQRRTLLQAMGFGAMTLGLPLRLLAQDSSLGSTLLADGIHLITGAGSNVVVAEGPDSVVVIDGGLQAHAGPLLAEINRITGNKPVTALFNTCWRPRHTGLNHLLGPRGVTIMGHENSRLWQTASFMVDWENRRYSPMPEEARINRSFHKGGSLGLGNENIVYGYIPQAHTDGDIWLHFTGANILVTGELLAGEAYPIMDWETGGWLGGFQQASRVLAELADDNTRVVPARGPVQDRAALVAQGEMMDEARNLVAEAYRNGLSLKEFKAREPEKKLGPVRPGADLFISQLYDGAWGHIRELGGMV